jgi:hypothetical protein
LNLSPPSTGDEPLFRDMVEDMDLGIWLEGMEKSCLNSEGWKAEECTGL